MAITKPNTKIKNIWEGMTYVNGNAMSCMTYPPLKKYNQDVSIGAGKG